MRVEGARLIAVSLSTLAHGALLGWLGAGGGEAIVPPQPIAVALVIEAAPVAAPAVAAHSAPDPALESRIPPPPEPAPPVDAASLSRPSIETLVAPPAPAPLAKPAPSQPAPKTPESVALIAPAAGGAAASAPAAEPAPRIPAPTGGAVATLTPRAAAPLAGAGNAPPVYPLAARRQGIEGRVILDVAVDPQGRATAVKVARSSGSRLLDEAALRAVRDWHFTPASLGGEPIAAKVQVPVTFRLDAPG